MDKIKKLIKAQRKQIILLEKMIKIKDKFYENTLELIKLGVDVSDL